MLIINGLHLCYIEIYEAIVAFPVVIAHQTGQAAENSRFEDMAYFNLEQKQQIEADQYWPASCSPKGFGVIIPDCSKGFE